MKTLIFDFDGTIADSFETFLQIFDELTPRADQLTPEEINKLRGSSLKQIIKYLRVRPWQIPKMVLGAKKLVSAKMDDIKIFAGLPAVIKKLHDDGHQMFILSTNSQANINKFLSNNQLEGYFIRIYGDIGLRSKTSALKKILKKEKLIAQDCAYIGDEQRDVESAKKAKLFSVGVGWGFNYPAAIKAAKPDAFAAKPHDLIKILS